MKTILVATNYSSGANNAIKYAAALARHTNSKIILFNSFELSIHAANTLLPASVIQELMEENRKHLKDVAFNVANIYGIAVECLTRTTDLQEELDLQFKRLKFDLVVIGMSEFEPGSYHYNTAASLIRHARYPILAVPEDAVFDGISRILFAYDPGCMPEDNKLTLLSEVAAFFNANVQVSHISKSDSLADYTSGDNAGVEEVLSSINHSYKDLTGNNFYEGIRKGIREYKADLLVMVPHHYGFWEGLLHKSKTGEMARKTHVPLLAIPNTAMA